MWMVPQRQDCCSVEGKQHSLNVIYRRVADLVEQNENPRRLNCCDRGVVTVSYRQGVASVAPLPIDSGNALNIVATVTSLSLSDRAG
jgi:hypothetical protein